jgi:hypothetical protein
VYVLRAYDLLPPSRHYGRVMVPDLAQEPVDERPVYLARTLRRHSGALAQARALGHVIVRGWTQFAIASKNKRLGLM